MSKNLSEPGINKSAAANEYQTRQLLRRPAPPAGSSGLSFCSARASVTAESGILFGYWIADYSSGVSFKTNDSTIFPGIYHDAGKTPSYGIRIPANVLVQVVSSIAIIGNVADGSHHIGWIIDGSYTVGNFGPALNSSATSSAFSATGIGDDNTVPEGLYHMAYLGDTQPWTVGTIHEWENWTNDPQDFQQEIQVTVIGALPT